MKKKTLMLILLALVFLCTAGMEFLNDPVELNPKEHPVYAGRTVEELAAEAKDELQDSCYAITGRVSEIGKKYDSFTITSADGKSEISCRTSEVPVKNEVALLSPGDIITVYGEVRKRLFIGGLVAEIKLLEKGAKESGSGVYYTDKGTRLDDSNTSKVTVTDEADKKKLLSYRIPSEWKKVEKKLDDKGDHIYGYQYRLNRLDKSPTPESLYVFYFDHNKNLMDRSRYDQTDRIEAAIVENILGKSEAGKCPESIRKSHYGIEYHYYDDKFEQGDEKYHVEFVFRKNGIDGLVVYMYIYRIPKKADEIMYVLRTTEIAE
ncbi:MAG: OB-fold nucleic acid binding domain-containing protein [Lachnospiraceae bacterium]|nr:OB-fold nucleic acid binding domain-containing protein [Lachnospiraceae bacterium]